MSKCKFSSLPQMLALFKWILTDTLVLFILLLLFTCNWNKRLLSKCLAGGRCGRGKSRPVSPYSSSGESNEWLWLIHCDYASLFFFSFYCCSFRPSRFMFAWCFGFWTCDLCESRGRTLFLYSRFSPVVVKTPWFGGSVSSFRML